MATAIQTISDQSSNVPDRPIFISVIIPCFNEASVLNRTLAHLTPWKAQLNFEIIVSDDCSQDESLQIARSWAATVVTNPGEPRGAAQARNRGAAQAKGDLLVFIDADILIYDPPFFFSTLRRQHMQNRWTAATVACRVYPWEATWQEDLFHRLYTPFLQLLNRVGIHVASGWCQIVPADAFWRVGGYDAQFTTGQDVDLFFRLGRLGRTRLLKCLMIHESPRRYRQTGIVKLVFSWFLNGLSVYLRRRPFLNHYPAIR